VYRAKHTETKQDCALKVMPRSTDNSSLENIVENEISVMKELDHPNIIRLLDQSFDAIYTNKTGREIKVYYLALELAPVGELFDIIKETGSFSEEI